MPILAAQTPMTLLALVARRRSSRGCCIARRSDSRCAMVGENPAAAEGQGLDVDRVRIGAIVARLAR